MNDWQENNPYAIFGLNRDGSSHDFAADEAAAAAEQATAMNPFTTRGEPPPGWNWQTAYTPASNSFFGEYTQGDAPWNRVLQPAGGGSGGWTFSGSPMNYADYDPTTKAFSNPEYDAGSGWNYRELAKMAGTAYLANNIPTGTGAEGGSGFDAGGNFIGEGAGAADAAIAGGGGVPETTFTEYGGTPQTFDGGATEPVSSITEYGGTPQTVVTEGGGADAGAPTGGVPTGGGVPQTVVTEGGASALAPWLKAAGLLAPILSGYFQSKAADDAAAGINNSVNKQTELQQKQFDAQAPWRKAGETALNKFMELLNDGSLTSKFPGMNPTEEAGFAFQAKEGQRAIDNSASARGGIGGAALKAGARFAEDNANKHYDAAFRRFYAEKEAINNPLFELAGFGPRANQQAQVATDNINSLGLYGARTNASRDVTQGNIYASGLEQLIAAGNKYYGG